MKRRALLFALGVVALATPLAAIAQPQQKAAYSVGILSASSPTLSGNLIEAFTQELRELGYTEGENVVIERRFAEGNLERLPALATDLVQRKVDVIFAPNTVAVRAAKQVAGAIPIVFASVDDPIEAGFVASLSRPGGNITGVSPISHELTAKRLQLLKEAAPNISRTAVFTSSRDSSSARQLGAIQRAASALGIEVLPIEMLRRDDLDPALDRLTRWHADSMFAVSNSENFYNRELLLDLAAKARLPMSFPSGTAMGSGALISYTPLIPALFQGAALYVDKILRGAKPADLPVEQPTKFQLVIDLKVAKTLGITIPPALLARADEVIE